MTGSKLVLFSLCLRTAGASFASTLLQQHNAARCIHGAAPLSWDNTLARHAQAWADRIQSNMQHGDLSFSPFGRVGQNIAMASSTGGWPGEENRAVGQWMSEEGNYRGGWSPSAGHYTQVVWKGTQRVGCGMWSGRNGGWNTQMLVCNYYPAGNMMGAFGQNVGGRVRSPSQCGGDSEESVFTIEFAPEMNVTDTDPVEIFQMDEKEQEHEGDGVIIAPNASAATCGFFAGALLMGAAMWLKSHNQRVVMLNEYAEAA